MFSISEIARIKEIVSSRAISEVDLALQQGRLEEYVRNNGIDLKENEDDVYLQKTMKILVFGNLSGDKNQFMLCAKKIGVPLDNIEFVTEWERLKNYQVSKLKHSMKYSDILFGPAPHNVKTKGDYSSFLAEIEANPKNYPTLTVLTANNTLKITKTNFSNGLMNTDWMKKFGNKLS